MNDPDQALTQVIRAIESVPGVKARFAQSFRNAFDHIYDGERTGRFSIEQLSRTEKAHVGSLVEIYIRRAFESAFTDGNRLDYLIAGHEVDCKFSNHMNQWMIPREAVGHLLLVCHANDKTGEWAVGLIRADESLLTSGPNRDGKTLIRADARDQIHWLFRGGDAVLKPNTLLQLDEEDRRSIWAAGDGTQRIAQLFRVCEGMLISRVTVQTVAQQKDSLKRVRANGGARSLLAPEGLVILGASRSNRRIAQELDLPVPSSGEFVAVRLVPADEDWGHVAEIDGKIWRRASPSDPTVSAPSLPQQ